MFRLASLALVAGASAETLAAVYNPATDQFSVAPLASLDAPPASGEVARCDYQATFLETGWDRTEARGLEGAADELQARGAGYAEGYLSALSIENNAVNTGVTTYQPSAGLQQYLDLNEQYVQAQLRAAAAHGSPEQRTYWHQVHLIRQQLHGLYEGYLASPYRTLSEPLTEEMFTYMNIGGDLEDLEDVLATATATATVTPVYDPSHCSALVKLTDDDLFISQVTWSALNEMTRAYKLYDFSYSLYPESDERVPARRVAFSSYPGNLFSGDDFYALSSGLVVMETTIGNSNADLNAFITPGCVLEWSRNILANRLATSGASWASWFERENSGSYNNANSVLDLNLYEPGQTQLSPETLMLVEQVPGFVVTTDISERLEREGYFPSFNVAYDPFVRAISGVDADEEAYGDFFNYEKAPRAQLFRRDQGKIETLADMKREMRQNDFENDPLSSQMETCDYQGMTDCWPSYTSENAISTRGDLNPTNGTWGMSAFAQRNHVGTDAKILVASEFDAQSLRSHAICGPTNDQQPTFVWSESFYKDVPHVGHPDVFDFEWQEVSW